MAAPRWMAAVNGKVTNRVLGRLARRAPGFGVVVHQGHRTGRVYRSSPRPAMTARRHRPHSGPLPGHSLHVDAAEPARTTRALIGSRAGLAAVWPRSSLAQT